MTPPTYEHFTLPGEIRLGVNSNSKLKTILIKLYMATDLDRTATRRALLPMVQRRGTRRLPDMQSISRYLEGLYGAVFHSSVAKVGEWHVTRYQLEVVNSLFLPDSEDLFAQGLELLRDLVRDPHEEQGSFQPEYVRQEKENLRRNIESLIDNKGAYAVFRCIEEMCREEPFRLSEQGRIDDITDIAPDALYRSYRQWIGTSPVSMYIAGDIGIETVREKVEQVFDFGPRVVQPLAPAPSPVKAGKVREVEERLDVNQGKLVLGFRHGVQYDSENEYEALLLMNGILGGFSHSKLFQNVRERASMAYSASSWVERTKGLLFINAGIAVEKYRDALKVILEQVDAIKQGEISDEEIDATVKTLLNHSLMLEDNFAALAEVDYVWGLHGRRLDLPAHRERLERVGREQIVQVARKLQHDTTYFLHN